jgi:hypothetical protein
VNLVVPPRIHHAGVVPTTRNTTSLIPRTGPSGARAHT